MTHMSQKPKRLGDIQPYQRQSLSNLEDTGLIEQCRVIGPGRIDPHKGDRVAAGYQVDRPEHVGGVRRDQRSECAHHGAVHLYFDFLMAARRVVSLGRGNTDLVGTGRIDMYRLSDRASFLDEGNLAPLRRDRVVAGEGLSLPAKPALPLKLHAEPVGSY